MSALSDAVAALQTASQAVETQWATLTADYADAAAAVPAIQGVTATLVGLTNPVAAVPPQAV